jgi:hypothetical protein
MEKEKQKRIVMVINSIHNSILFRKKCLKYCFEGRILLHGMFDKDTDYFP